MIYTSMHYSVQCIQIQINTEIIKPVSLMNILIRKRETKFITLLFPFYNDFLVFSTDISQILQCHHKLITADVSYIYIYIK